MPDATTRWQAESEPESSQSGLARQACTLDRLTAAASDLSGIRRTDLCAGDWVLVRTKNSLYSLAVVGDGTFVAAGGWFAGQSANAVPVRITGCTWGGTAVHCGMVAAPGMYLEFGNGVRTTRIREVRVLRGSADAQRH